MKLLETCGSEVLRGQLDGWNFDFYVEGLVSFSWKNFFNSKITEKIHFSEITEEKNFLQ